MFRAAAALAACLILSVAHATTQYGVLIDAGSTGSRLHVFSWPSRNTRTLPVPLTRPVAQSGWSKKIEGGIATFASHLDEIPGYLGELLDFAEDTVGKKVDLGTVPIYLMATAGMRILRRADRNAILTKVRAVLHVSPFSFSDSQARVIAGEEEGVYGWVTANYLASRLEGPAGETVGALDLGGASTQITFAPQGEVLANLFWLHLSTNLNRRLYTHSYLYYGVNQAEDRVARALAAPGATVVDAPCYNEGYTRNFTTDDGSSEPYILLRGTGNFTACRLQAKALMGLDDPCYTEPASEPGHQACALNGVYQPPLPDRFYGFSTFAYMAEFLTSYFKLPEQPSVAEIADGGAHLCSTSYAELKKLTGGDSPYLHRFCFYAAYSTALLQDGYGFPGTSRAITFSNKVDGTDMSWALGAILFEANLLPAHFEASTAFRTAFLICVPILSVAVLIFVPLYCYTRRQASMAGAASAARADSTPSAYAVL